MSLSNVILLSQIAGYAIALILALCVMVPMSLQQDEFRGHCLLFSSGEWSEEDGQLLVQWASQLYCNYVIFVGAMCALAAGAQTYRMARLLCKGDDSSFVSAFVDVMANVFLSIAVLIAALMVTMGFLKWCDVMTQRFPSCETAAGQKIDERDGVDTHGFYVQLGSAQFGAWASFACWVGLSVCALLKLCRYHQLHNLRASMYRERQKLIAGAHGSIVQPGPTSLGEGEIVEDAVGGNMGSRGPIQEVE